MIAYSLSLIASSFTYLQMVLIHPRFCTSAAHCACLDLILDEAAGTKRDEQQRMIVADSRCLVTTAVPIAEDFRRCESGSGETMKDCATSMKSRQAIA